MWQNIMILSLFIFQSHAYAYQLLSFSGCGGPKGRNSTILGTKLCCSNAKIKWRDGRLRIARDSKTFPKDAPYTKAFVKAWSRWNSSPAKVNISTYGAEDLKANLYNGRNEVWFESGSDSSRLTKESYGVIW